ncbi:ABC transporter substrate-binding protein [Myxacorys almedinensis]|uniref:ABC transporter substrate-binding protein n=1 Tax=Myxacorys almedinensis A TaxID=2690445 RepID=A0A8J8CPR9_9CYAN|nr:ABC transporter substrate-binding protein [Myxacorys almedinensis]NDJ19877.1 ABC transporter substrate-binding protein [Myxacorys almedinensis A]
MSQKNETRALLVSLLVTAGLLGGGFWWFSQRSGLRFDDNASTLSPQGSLQDRISQGERILLPSESSNPEFNSLKQAGVSAIAAARYADAVPLLESAMQKHSNAPETLIYLNNARIGQRKAYTIAVAVPIKTDVAGSAEILRGVAQAQNDLNRGGGINGAGLKVAIANDDNDPDLAQQIARAFVQTSDILGVVGHYASDVSLAAGSVYNTNQLVSISPISTTVKLSGFGQYVFRTVPSDYVAARALADYAATTLQQPTVAVFFNSQSAYSQSLKSEFVTAVSLTGGQVSNEFDLSSADFSAARAVDQALKSGAKALMLAANTGTLDKALQVVQVNRKRSLLLGGDDVYAPKTLEVGGEQAEGMVVAVPWHIERDPRSPFARRSRQLWGADVNWRSAIAYDATQALIAALRQNPTRQGIQQALSASTFSAAGASQTVRFLPSGDRNAGIQLVNVVPGNRSGAGFDFTPVARN